MHQKFEELIAESRLSEQSRHRLERISRRLKYFRDFTPLQKEAFGGEDFWDVKKHLMICGATSSGKTLVAEIAMLLADGNGQNAIYLSPLRAMVSEKYKNFKKDFDYDGADGNRRVLASDKDHQNDDYDITEGDFSAAVIVYEKFYALLAQGNAQKMLQNCGLIIFDEIQMIANEERGIKIIMSLLNARKHNPNIRFVFMTTSHSDMSVTEKLLRENMELEISTIINNQNSMALEEIVLCNNGRFRGRYSPSIDNTEMEREELEALLERKAQELGTEITSHELLPSMAVTKCNDEDKRERKYRLLLDIIRAHKDRKIIVFINSRGVCRKNASRVASERIFQRKELSSELKSKLASLADTNQRREFLNDLMPCGIAYHHGGLSQAYRDIIEEEFSKDDGALNVLFATETLAIGVNLPADIIIVYDTEKREKTEERPMPIDTQTYKNYIGRSGRLGVADKSFIPRIYLLALSESELDRYYATYVDARPTKIVPAYETMMFDTALPYFLSMLSAQDYTVDELEDEIKKRMPKLLVDGYFKELLTKAHTKRVWPGQGKVSNPRFYIAWDNMRLLDRNEPDILNMVYEETYALSNFGAGILPYALSLHDCHNIYQYMLCESDNNMIIREGLEGDFSEERSAVSLLYFICRLPAVERFNKFYVERFERNASLYNTYDSALRSYFNKLVDEGTLSRDSLIGKVFSEDKADISAENLTAVLRAFILELWRCGRELDDIAGIIGVPMNIEEGDMERLADAASFALEAVSSALPASKNDVIIRAATGFRKLAHRVHYGGCDDIARIMSCHTYGLSRDSVIRLKKRLQERGICDGSVFRYLSSKGDYVYAVAEGITKGQCEDIRQSLSTRYAPAKTEKCLYNLRKDGLVYDDLETCLEDSNLTLRNVNLFLEKTAEYAEMPYLVTPIPAANDMQTECFRLCSSYISICCAVIDANETDQAIRAFSRLVTRVDGKLAVVADRACVDALKSAAHSLAPDGDYTFLTPEELLRLYLECLVYRDRSSICNIFVYNLYKRSTSDSAGGSLPIELPTDRLFANNPVDVFISYSHRGCKELIPALLDFCDSLDKNVFLDIISIPRGDNFVKKIIGGINQADTFVCFVDREYAAGNWTEAEFSAILDRGISRQCKVLAVCLDDEGYRYACDRNIGAINLIDARRMSMAALLDEIKRSF